MLLGCELLAPLYRRLREKVLISGEESDPVGRRSIMPEVIEIVYEEDEIDVPGPRWHKPSKQYIAQMGYHIVTKVDPEGAKTSNRVRTTHYLGSDPTEATNKYYQFRKDWIATRNEQRTAYDEEQERRRREKLPLLPRFKPVWPKATERAVKRISVIVAPLPAPVASALPYPVPAFKAQADEERAEVFSLTIQQAYDRYLVQQKERIGLHGGKGINQNSYDRHCLNLTLSLALNKTYSRTTRPIDVNKRLCDLTRQDYQAFVQFWCNPTNVKSERTSKNYVGVFGRMLHRLRVPLPDDFESLFNIKLTQPTKIARYDPDLLRKLLQHPRDRVRMMSHMCLNLGYYQVDMARLKLEHITDAEGNPYVSGEMFITKRRERTLHQNRFTTTAYVWPETQRLMEQFRGPLKNVTGHYFISRNGTPYSVKGFARDLEESMRKLGLKGKFSTKQFRKVGASVIKSLDGSDAMKQYKSNALDAADKPYITEDYSRLTQALKNFRAKLIADGVLVPIEQ